MTTNTTIFNSIKEALEAQIPIVPEDPETKLYFAELKRVINSCGPSGSYEIDPMWDSTINRKTLGDMIRKGHITFQLIPADKIYTAEKKVRGNISITSGSYSSYSGSAAGGTFELPIPPPETHEIPIPYTWLIKPTPEGLDASKVNTFADNL